MFRFSTQPFTLRHLRLSLASLALLLCLTQWGVLQHSVEHPFHTASASCDIYLFCEHTGHGLVAEAASVPNVYLSEQRSTQFLTLWQGREWRIFRVRGPPSFIS